MGWGWQLFRAQIFFKQSSCFQVCTLSCILWQLITSKPRVLRENIISFLFGIPLCRHLVCNFSSDNYPSTCFPSFTKQLRSWNCWSLFGPSPAFLCSPVCLSFFLILSHSFHLPLPIPSSSLFPSLSLSANLGGFEKGEVINAHECLDV